MPGAVSGMAVTPAVEGALPECLVDLAHTALDLLVDGEQGLWHVDHQRGPSRWDGREGDMGLPVPTPQWSFHQHPLSSDLTARLKSA